MPTDVSADLGVVGPLARYWIVPINEYLDMPASLVEELRAVPPAQLDSYLTERSGLPGPRGNLELMDAFAVVADAATILRCADAPDEYIRCCGTEALGRLIAENPRDPAPLALARERASDELWRVREAAARALQLVGDSMPIALPPIVADWIRDQDPYVKRAAIAAICEPRLLRDPAAAAAALDACADATRWIVALGGVERRAPAVRTLRQGLGYCWSVAIAASPAEGLVAFNALRGSSDPDVAWIVRSNLTKARLRRLL